MILTALDGKPLPIYGDGGNVRDWLYVGDHCAAIARILAAGHSGETYNVGGNHERTNLQIVDTLCTALDRLSPRADGRSYGAQKTFVTDRPGHDRRYAIDSTKVQDSTRLVAGGNLRERSRKNDPLVSRNTAHGANRVSADKYSRERLGHAIKACTTRPSLPFKGIILAGGSGTQAVSTDADSQQAAHAGLRQTDDLLSPERAHALGHSGNPDHQHARRLAAVRAAVR